jgi:SNF2 family DNA or RNA helicase
LTQKGSAVSGALLTQEVLDSSDHILAKTHHGNFKGAQQFFTPEEAANLAAYVTGSGRGINVPVFDPTAGNGSFLKPVPPALAFGVEIDADQVKAAEGSYNAVQGDIQKVAPLIYRVAPEFPAIWANPPFGLRDWSDPTVNDGKPVGSVVLTFVYAMRQLADDGQLVFICGRDQFYREIAQRPEAKGIYYVVECDDLGKNHGFEHPAAIAFGVNPLLRTSPHETPPSGYQTKNVPLEMLDLLGPKIVEERELVIGRYNSVARQAWGGGYQFKEAWTAIEKEYNRRRKSAEGEKVAREFDLELVGGKVLNFQPSPYVALALGKRNLLTQLKALNGKPLDWFANYERDWIIVEEALADGLISVQPKLVDAIEEMLTESRRTVCPLYPIKDAQRLGYLTDLNSIKCKRSDDERGLVAGESYRITARSATINTKVEKVEKVLRGKNAGELVKRTYEQQRKVLQIFVDNRLKFTDSASDQSEIQYFLDHFEIPDPGDVGTRYPEETEYHRELLRQVETDKIIPCSTAYAEEHPEKQPVRFRNFQIEDLARLGVKHSGLISWEQGLGKTLGGLAFFEMCVKKGAQRAGLFIVPQDLIPQWQEECQRFLGEKMTLIKTHGEAHEVARKLRMGGTGLYITYYEAMAVNGTGKSELEDEIIVEQKREMVKEKGTGKYGMAKLCVQGEDGWVGVTRNEEDGELYDADGNLVQNPSWIPVEWESRGDAMQPPYARYIPDVWVEKTRNITSAHICPECKSDRQSGWNGKFCRAENDIGEQCGYSHYKHKVKPMGSLLSTAFRYGVIVVDEGTMIQGDYSARSMVVRGLRTRYKLLMTGTPVKNYIPQAFWLLWWALGNSSKRFPYSYTSKSDFENNHAVIQWLVMGGKKSNRKVLPEVTNLSQLWRLLASSIIRRRKEETGETLVKRTLYPITVPLGEVQREQMEKWRKDFHKFFEEKYPDSDVVKAGMAELMAPMLGMRMKLDYAATIPQGDPDHGWTGIEGVSNFTPANLRTLEIAMTLAKQGRKVLVGSQWTAACKWLTERLEEKGVPVGNLLDTSGNLVSPPKRAKLVKAFQTGELQVLVASVQSIRYGHNLDAANACVLNGLPDDYESFDQYIARIHRLTSKHEVDVYVVIPGSQGGDKGTITRKKWDILRQKGDAANLALDGRLIEPNEEQISENEVMKSLAEKGVPIVGDEVPEEEIERIWNEVPSFAQFTPDESVLHPTLEVVEAFGDDEEPTEEGKAAAEAIGAFLHALGSAPPVDVLATIAESVDVDTFLTAVADAIEDEFLDGLGEADDPLADVEDEIVSDAIHLLPPEVNDDELAVITEEEENETEAEPEPVEAQQSLFDPDPEPEPAQGINAPMKPQDIVETIKSLKELHDLGILDDNEFATGKADLLAGLKGVTA